jgi:dipeptidyl aminopeptidase/acylaminoacyl peptidase
MAITGGSAGGWTVLCALAFHDAFAAGSDLYGVADIRGFMDDTHKFESRYLDWLVGPETRNPVDYADDIRVPVIVLQGLEDRVVPPSQSEKIVAALARNGIPHAYLAFEGEQHGFRRAETLERVLEAQLSFYGQVLGFAPADAVDPVVLAT